MQNTCGTEAPDGQPRTFNGDLAALPAALRPLTEHRRWVVWKWAKIKSGKWTKPPHRADNPRAKARSNEPATWSTYAVAAAAVKAGRADGIGYMMAYADGLPNGIGAIDLDKCRDPDTGELTPWAQELVDGTGSYVEVTVSGTGLRIVGSAEGDYLDNSFPAPDGGEIELYRHATRFITISGLEIGNCNELQNIDELMARTHEKFAGQAAPRCRAARPRRRMCEKPIPASLLALCDGHWGKGISTDPDDFPEFDLYVRAINLIPNPDLTWKEWKRIIMAIWAAFLGNDDGLAAAHAFSRKSDKYDAAGTDQAWDEVTGSPPSELSAGTLLYMADQASPGWRDDDPDDCEPEADADGTSTHDAEGKAKDEGPPTSDAFENGKPKPPLTVNEWLDYDLHPLDRLLGDLISTTSRVMVVGPTGLGKTMFGLAISFHIPQGKDFMHWKASRPGRVLYVDGEMSNRQMKRRIQAELKRSGGVVPDGLLILNREFFPDMPPLNTVIGQKWLDKFIIKEHGPFDLIIFDNIQSLLVGNVKDNEQWADTLPYVRDLTRRGIGQIWFHHTGFDESHSYGDKSREWQLDTVVMMERVKTQDDLAFRLTFPKARERCPENRADFEDVVLVLRGDEWVYTASPKAAEKPLGQNQRVMLRMLQEAGPNGLTEEDWRAQAGEVMINRQRFYEAKLGLRDRGLVCEVGGRWREAM